MKGCVRLIGLGCLGGILVSSGMLWSQPVQVTRERPETYSSEEQDFTDEERHRSQTFVNEALGNKIIKEECAKLKDPNACEGRGEGGKLLGLDSQMISYAGKAYALLMGSGSVFQGLDAKAPEDGTAAPEDGAQAPEESKTKRDYCILIGSGAETVGASMDMLSSKTIQSPAGGKTDQKKILYKAARSHRDKAKTATIKAAGWGGASACYAYMMTSGGAALGSTKNILKMGAAGLLTAFYFKERGVHNNYADAVKKIADKLPGPGDCNPVTQKDCYCSLKEYQNDPEHCLPYLHKRKLSQGTIVRVACTNQKLQADPQCECVATDTCLDRSLKNHFQVSGAGSGFIASPIGQDALSLARGELKSGDLTSSPMRRHAGLNGFFRGNGKKIPPQRGLNPSQEREASRLSEHFGLPRELSRRLVAAPAPANLPEMAARLGLAAGKGVTGLAAANKKRSGQVWGFRGGKGLQGKNKKRAGSSDILNWKKYLPKGKEKKKSSAGKVVRFDSQAVNDGAGVSKDRAKNIFHIISRRYMLWRIETHR